MPQTRITMPAPSLFSSLIWGMGLGAGSEIGHQAVRSLTGANHNTRIQEESKGVPQEVNSGGTQEMNHPCAAATLEFLNVRV